MSEKTQEREVSVNSEGFIERPLTDHKNNKFNRECVNILTNDHRASDGAHHSYRIIVQKEGATANTPTEKVEEVVINFQNGGLKEVGANGITDQALLAIILDRVRSFNEGPFRCRENSMIITKGEEMMMWMEKRSNDRARRGVEGERLS